MRSISLCGRSFSNTIGFQNFAGSLQHLDVNCDLLFESICDEVLNLCTVSCRTVTSRCCRFHHLDSTVIGNQWYLRMFTSPHKEIDLINDLSKEEFEPEDWKPGKSGLDAHM